MASNNNDNWTGCLGVVLLLVLIPKLLMLIDSVVNLIIIATPLIVIYLLFRWDKKTNAITDFSIRILKSNEKKQLLNEPEKPMLIEIGEKKQDEEVLKKMDDITDKLERMEFARGNDIESTVKRYVHEIDRKNKEQLRNDILGNADLEYSGADTYELQKQEASKKQREENLSNREFQQGINEQVFMIRQEGWEGRFNLQREMMEGLMYLEKKVTDFQGFVTEKFLYIDNRITTEIAVLDRKIGDLRVEIKQEFADFKVQVGREIVRLDKYMLQVVGKLEQYNARVEICRQDVRQVKIDAERQNIRAERMLNQAQHTYANHRADLKVMGKEIDKAVTRISLYDSQFATKVAQSKLAIDRASMEHVNAVKQIALEKQGVAHLRSDHLSRQRESESRQNALIGEKRHIEEKMRLNQNHHEKLSALRHQLNMNQESLEYERNRSNVMRQEFSLFQKFSKNERTRKNNK